VGLDKKEGSKAFWQRKYQRGQTEITPRSGKVEMSKRKHPYRNLKPLCLEKGLAEEKRTKEQKGHGANRKTLQFTENRSNKGRRNLADSYGNGNRGRRGPDEGENGN